MNNIDQALKNLDSNMIETASRRSIPFDEFLQQLRNKPKTHLRDVYQIFHDMVKTYVGKGKDEYPGDPESVNFLDYNCTNLFQKDLDNPFFADRLFANRFMNRVAALKHGAQQNKIFVFELFYFLLD